MMLRVKLKRTPLDVVIEGVPVFAMVATVALVATSLHSLPQRIPHHFNLVGIPDGWGSKSVLLFLPAISLVLYAALTAVSRRPDRFNFPWGITEQNVERQYRIALSLIARLKAEVMILFAYLTWGTIRVAEGRSSGLGGLLLPFVLVALLTTVAVHLLAAQRAR